MSFSPNHAEAGKHGTGRLTSPVGRFVAKNRLQARKQHSARLRQDICRQIVKRHEPSLSDLAGRLSLKHPVPRLVESFPKRELALFEALNLAGRNRHDEEARSSLIRVAPMSQA